MTLRKEGLFLCDTTTLGIGHGANGEGGGGQKGPKTVGSYLCMIPLEKLRQNSW